MNRWNIAFGLLLAASAPAHAGFTTIPFKYTSMAHLGVDGSRTAIHRPYKQVAASIADYLRRNGAAVTTFDQTKFGMVQSEHDRACEKWMVHIFQQEFASYRANKFSEFKKIDRTAPASCQPKGHWLQYGFTPVPLGSFEDNAFHITAVADRSLDRTINYVSPSFSTLFGYKGVANVWSMVPHQVNTRLDFQTVYNVWVWKDPITDAANVFAIATPKSGGIESSPTASIGHQAYRLADGTIEAAGVSALIAWINQLAIENNDASSAP